MPRYKHRRLPKKSLADRSVTACGIEYTYLSNKPPYIPYARRSRPDKSGSYRGPNIRTVDTDEATTCPRCRAAIKESRSS